LLPPGTEVTFGRAAQCDIRLPADDHISRRAGLLRALDDCVLVRNFSTTKPLVLRPPDGEDRVVEPEAATASLPYGLFQVVVAGRGGVGVALDVDARPLAPEPDAPDAAGIVTVTRPVEVTAAEQRMLVELCRPILLSRGGIASPASYSEIGERLGRRPQYVRNRLKALRETLDGMGVPGLVAESPGRGEDFRPALARWALRSRWVTRADLEGAR
jgi:hypothetical protein